MKNVNYLIKHLFSLILLSAFIVSCSDDDTIFDPEIPDNPSGVLILNEGAMGVNNAGLSYFETATGTTITDIYKGKLGDTAQDMNLYGNKLYISVSGSNIISVVNKKDLTEISKIQIKKDATSLSPRYIEAYNGKIYVTCQEPNTRNGYVMKIDTISLEIEAYAQVGMDPEDLAVCNGKLYVANSGASNWTSPANTLSVVDLHSFREEEKITVGANPFRVKSDNNRNIYLTYQGIFGSISGGFQKLDTRTKEVFNIADRPKQDFQIMDNLIYFYDVTYTSSSSVQNGIGIYDMDKQEFLEKPFISDDTEITDTPYGIGINPVTKDVYLATTDYKVRGKVLVFNQEGKKINELTVGINPNTFIFF